VDFRVMLSIRPDETSGAQCHTYPARPPILLLQGSGHTFTITAPSDADPQALLGFAQTLRDAAVTYAHAVEHAAGYREPEASGPRPYPRFHPA
jgi:hypothetical protein